MDAFATFDVIFRVLTVYHSWMHANSTASPAAHAYHSILHYTRSPAHKPHIVSDFRTNTLENLFQFHVRNVTHHFITVPGDNKNLQAEWFEQDNEKYILHFHGGGFIGGSPAAERHWASEISYRTEMNVVSLKYRLAPENTLEDSISDALQAYLWIRSKKPSKIVLSGSSAGGTLLIMLLNELKEKNIPYPDAASAISPWIDYSCSGEAYQKYANVDYIQKEVLLWMKSIIKKDHEHVIFNLDQNHFKWNKMLFSVGEMEIMKDDSKVFAKNLGADYIEAPMMVHGFHVMYPYIPEALFANVQIVKWIKNAIL